MSNFKIGQVAKELGVTTSTLRFYENRGVVTPQRTLGGTRFYSRDNIESFRTIIELAKAGVPIKVIEQLSTLRRHHDTGDSAGKAVSTIIEPLATEMRAKIELFSQVERDLRDALEQVRGCYDCKQPPTAAGCQGCDIAETLTGKTGPKVFNVIWEQQR